MREIKFRGKSLKDGRWVYGYLCTDKYINENGTEWLVDPETVCQYTGMKDKNGVEIYEGDILKLTSICYEVIYEETSFIVRNARYFKTTIGNLKSRGAEVIGNVWGNPELLEVTE